MIVGNIIALLGFYALPEMRAAAPSLVPMHIAFYLLQLMHGFEARPARRATT
jgi:hypothetical protein